MLMRRILQYTKQLLENVYFMIFYNPTVHASIIDGDLFSIIFCPWCITDNNLFVRVAVWVPLQNCLSRLSRVDPTTTYVRTCTRALARAMADVPHGSPIDRCITQLKIDYCTHQADRRWCTMHDGCEARWWWCEDAKAKRCYHWTTTNDKGNRLQHPALPTSRSNTQNKVRYGTVR